MQMGLVSNYSSFALVLSRDAPLIMLLSQYNFNETTHSFFLHIYFFSSLDIIYSMDLLSC